MTGRRWRYWSLAVAIVAADPVVPLQTSVAHTAETLEDRRLDIYARARLAEAEGNMSAAANAYRDAFALDPSSLELAQHGYRQAVLAGDRELAMRAAYALDHSGLLPRDGTMLLLIDALDRHKWANARALIDRLDKEGNLAFVVPFMKSWVSIHDGPYDPPVVPVDKPYATFSMRYLEEQLLLQHLERGDVSQAVDALEQTEKHDTSFGPEERAEFAARFAKLGRRDVALHLMRNKIDGDLDMNAALVAAEKHYRDVRFSPQMGLAMLMNRLALDLLGHDDGMATLSIARVASFAEPGNDDIRLTVARAALADQLPALAFAETEKVDRSSPAWLDAQSLQLHALLQLNRGVEAVAQAQQIVNGLDSARSWRLLGDMLAQIGDFGRAAHAYGEARARVANKNDPALLLQLGGALEQDGDWASARPLLEKVVELAPDSAVALNHLGYSLADRGEDLPRAISLLTKANRLRPKEPAFIDSLGWALFKAGEYSKALPLIRGAAAADPGNAEINDHLGDILWAMGRHFEARYAWRAALATLDDDAATEKLREQIEYKMKFGGVVAVTR